MTRPTGPAPQQHRAMHRLWRAAGVVSRADRLALTAAVVQRPLLSSADLTTREADSVLRYLRRLDAEGVLAAKADEWLATHRAAAT